MSMKSALAAALLFFSSCAYAAELVEIKVEGLTGEGSEALLRQQLEMLNETEMAEADSITERAFISVKEGMSLSDDAIRNAIQRTGYKVISISRSGNGAPAKTK